MRTLDILALTWVTERASRLPPLGLAGPRGQGAGGGGSGVTRGHRPGSGRTRSSHPRGGRAHPARREGTSGGRRARRECPGGPPSPERPGGKGGADARGFGGRRARTDASSPRGSKRIVSCVQERRLQGPGAGTATSFWHSARTRPVSLGGCDG